jgi:hypothetical protein
LALEICENSRQMPSPHSENTYKKTYSCNLQEKLEALNQCYMTFYDRNLRMFTLRGVFVPVKTSKPSLMFVGAFPRVEQL